MNKAIMLASIPALAGASLNHGGVYACQNSDLQAAHRVEDLTDYLFGLPEADAEMALRELLPAIEVGRNFHWYSVDGKAMTEVDDSDIRAPHALFKRVNVDPEKKNHTQTTEKGLAMVIDRSLVGAHTTLEREKRRAVKQLRNRLARIEYLRAMNLLDSSANNTNKVWGAASDPDADIEAVVDKVGLPKDTVLFSRTGWSLRRGVYRQKDAENAVFADHARMGLNDLGDYYGVPNVRKDDLPIQKGKRDGKTVTLSNKVIAYHRGQSDIVSSEEIDKLNPASIARFWTPVDQGESAGRQWGVLEYEMERMIVIAVYGFSKIIATNSSNIEKLTVTAS